MKAEKISPYPLESYNEETTKKWVYSHDPCNSYTVTMKDDVTIKYTWRSNLHSQYTLPTIQEKEVHIPFEIFEKICAIVKEKR